MQLILINYDYGEVTPAGQQHLRISFTLTGKPK